MWSFFYLFKNYSYEDAIKDIVSKGGDTKGNAAVVGGLLGAANRISFNFSDINEFAPRIEKIVKNAPKATFEVTWSNSRMNFTDFSVHYEKELKEAL